MSMQDTPPVITKITAIIEADDGTRMRWEADNRRARARLAVEARYVEPDMEFRLPPPADCVYFPNRSVEFKFSTTDEARLTLIPSEETLVDPAAGDAVKAAVDAWERYVQADNVIDQADHLLTLNGAMCSLASWVRSEQVES